MKLSRGVCSIPHPVSRASDLSWGHITLLDVLPCQSSSHWRREGPHCWEQWAWAGSSIQQQGWEWDSTASRAVPGVRTKGSPELPHPQVFVGCSFVHFCVLRNLSVTATVKASQKWCDVMLRQIFKVCNIIPGRFSLLNTPEHSCSYVTVLHPRSGFFSCF